MVLADLLVTRKGPEALAEAEDDDESSLCGAFVASAAASALVGSRESWLISTFYDGESTASNASGQDTSSTNQAGSSVSAAGVPNSPGRGSMGATTGSRLSGLLTGTNMMPLEVIAAVAIYLGGADDTAVCPQKTHSPGVYTPITLSSTAAAHAQDATGAAGQAGGFAALEGLPFLVSGQFHLLRGSGANGLHLLDPFLAAQSQAGTEAPTPSAQARNVHQGSQAGPSPSVASNMGHMTISDLTRTQTAPQSQQQHQGPRLQPSQGQTLPQPNVAGQHVRQPSSPTTSLVQGRAMHNKRVLDGVNVAWLQAFQWACRGGGGGGGDMANGGPFVGHLDRCVCMGL